MKINQIENTIVSILYLCVLVPTIAISIPYFLFIDNVNTAKLVFTFGCILFGVLLITSIMSIYVHINMKKDKLLTSKQFAIHIICQLIFVIDVIDIIVFYKKMKQRVDE